MKIAVRRFLARRFFIGDANGRTRSVARYVLVTAPHGSLSRTIPRAPPAASGPHPIPRDKADHHKNCAEQDQRERVGPVAPHHRGTRLRRASRRF
jgi:hypothetical protein